MSLDDNDKRWIQEELRGVSDHLIEIMRGMQTELLCSFEAIETKLDHTK